MLHRAAKGVGGGDLDGLAGLHGGEGLADIVARTGDRGGDCQVITVLVQSSFRLKIALKAPARKC